MSQADGYRYYPERRPTVLQGAVGRLVSGALSNSAIQALLLAAPVYPVGFAALFWQLQRVYGWDYATTWYAASLVPKTTILLQTVVVVLGLSLVLLSLLSPAAVGIAWLFTRVSGIIRAVLEELKREEYSVLVAVLTIAAPTVPITLRLLGLITSLRHGARILIVLIVSGYLAILTVVANWFLWQVGLEIPIIALCSITVVLCIFGAFGTLLFSVGLSPTTTSGWMISALVVAYTGCLAAAIIAMGQFDPRLPSVTLRLGSALPDGRKAVEGKLLSQHEGYWYITDGQGGLLALKQDTVTSVQSD